jgi:hypothetical protein
MRDACILYFIAFPAYEHAANHRSSIYHRIQIGSQCLLFDTFLCHIRAELIRKMRRQFRMNRYRAAAYRYV